MLVHPLKTEILNPDQKKVFAQLTDFILNNRQEHISVLMGYAGTGKSFVINRIVEYCLDQIPVLRFSMTAPTHKAVRELKIKSEYPDHFTFATIHSLLGLKQDVTSKGKVVYKRDYEQPADKIQNTDVLIVDEASMLNKELFDTIVSVQKKLRFKIIFVGDPKQLNPVGEIESSPFLPQVQKKHGMIVMELTEIVRQSQGNPIIEYATAVRNKRSFDFSAADKGLSGVSLVNKTMLDLYPVLKQYFLSEEFKQNPDYVKIVAWRNQTADYFNSIVRQMVYHKKSLPKVLQGDYLVADRPIMVWDSKKGRWHCIISTNEEMTVTSDPVITRKKISYDLYEPCSESFTTVQQARLYVHTAFEGEHLTEQLNKIATHDFTVPLAIKSQQWNHYELEVKQYTCKVRLSESHTGFLDQVIHVLHEDSEKDFTALLEQLKTCAIRTQDDYKKRKLWISYYNIQNHFAWTKYNYAITSHKAQGSTYDNVIVHEWDIDLNLNQQERDRSKYVAVTRAKNKLFIVK